jgi:hypothetical protein
MPAKAVEEVSPIPAMLTAAPTLCSTLRWALRVRVEKNDRQPLALSSLVTPVSNSLIAAAVGARSAGTTRVDRQRADLLLVGRVLDDRDVDGAAAGVLANDTDPDNDPLTYEWDFQDDGTIDAVGVTERGANRHRSCVGHNS